MQPLENNVVIMITIIIIMSTDLSYTCTCKKRDNKKEASVPL